MTDSSPGLTRAAPALMAGATLAAAALPPLSRPRQLAVFGLGTILVGTPHGGLDHRPARQLWEARWGRWWLAPFGALYALLSGATLLLWRRRPDLALGSFLLLSSAHFGAQDARGRGALRLFDAAVRGAVPILLPAHGHGPEMARAFALLAGKRGPALVRRLRAPGSALWAGAAGALFALGDARGRAELIAQTALFARVPPLLSFTFYFAGVHAPRAMRGARRPGETIMDLIRASLPLTLGAVAVAALAHARAPRPARGGDALIRTVFIGLSALTVPHMALAALARAHKAKGAA